MEDYKLLIEKAKREIMIADHMTYVTSRLINDKKIVVSIVDHINKAVFHAMNAWMYYEKMYKRLRNVPQDTDLMLRLFFSKYAKVLNLENSLETMTRTIHHAMESYNKRGMMLTRTNRFVIVSPSYELIDFKRSDVKDWLNKTKNFVNIVGEKLK